MNREQVAEKVEEYIRKNFVFDDSAGPARDDSLLDTGVIDSTGVLELISYIEGTFGIAIEDEELTPDNLDSIDRITGFIESKRA